MSKIFKAHTVSYDAEKKFLVESTADFLREAAAVEVEPEIEPQIYVEEVKEDPLELARVMADELIRKARGNAESIVEEANKEARAIQLQANMDAEELLESVRREGYEEGYTQGINAADSTRIEAEGVLRDAKQRREEILAGIENEVVELIIGSVKKIFDRTYEIDRNTVVYLIKRALSEATVTENVKIHVSKDDYDNIIEGKDEIAAVVKGAADDIEYIRNLSLNKGDCVIETAFGNIDCGLDGQFERLKKNLLLIYEGKRI